MVSSERWGVGPDEPPARSTVNGRLDRRQGPPGRVTETSSRPPKGRSARRDQCQPPGGAPWLASAGPYVVPDDPVRHLLPDRLRRVVAAAAPRPPVEAVHAGRQLCVLRLVGLALLLPAGRRHRGQPDLRGGDQRGPIPP